MTQIKVLKIHKWWTSHYGTMIAFAYLAVALSPSPPPLLVFLRTLVIFTIASIGIASFGQLLNDLTDIAQDVRSGAQNLLAHRGLPGRLGIFICILAVGLLPWLWLPVSPVIIVLIAAEYLLFALYSLAPVRLKSRGIFGPVADALYGYVITNTIVLLLFAKLGGGIPAWLIIVIAVWTFLFGLKQIIHHQLVDESRDRIDNIKTFVVVRGWWSAFRILRKIILPLNALTFIVLLISLAPYTPAIPLVFAIHAILLSHGWAHHGLWNTAHPRQQSAIDQVHLLSDLIIDNFTWYWLPPLSLSTLIAVRPEYLILVVPHLILFPQPVIWAWQKGIPAVRRLTHAA